eukprot:8771115-Pyramimonas_sp.AAC.1
MRSPTCTHPPDDRACSAQCLASPSTPRTRQCIALGSAFGGCAFAQLPSFPAWRAFGRASTA